MIMNSNVSRLPQQVELNGKNKIMPKKTVTISHGSGGKAMHDLIENCFVKHFGNPILCEREDQARIDLKKLAELGNRLAFTTDSFVIDPIFFPGGDIGMLAVNGTVNDLAVGGAIPLYLSCGFILEEGLPLESLECVVKSMKEAAQDVDIKIVTGDTKVVPRGAADKLFINTAGIGVIPHPINISAARATPGDKVIINGYMGDHGAAILHSREELSIVSSIQSDCQPLNKLVQKILEVCPDIHCMRDATRGGVATVLNEFALSAKVGIVLEEENISVRNEVRAICEILGLDPLYLANEGILIAIVPDSYSQIVLERMKSLPEGRHASVIGEIVETPEERVIMKTSFGGDRIVDMMVGEQLPRIC